MSQSNHNSEIDPQLAAQESLDEVLNDLEDMLQERRQLDDPIEPLDAEPVLMDKPWEDETGQFNIPLLDDVVALNNTRAPNVSGVPTNISDIVSELDFDPKLIAELSNRLRNELEVIVQSGLERLTAKATKEIMFDVKAHLDIILPEIIAEACDSLPDDDFDEPPSAED